MAALRWRMALPRYAGHGPFKLTASLWGNDAAMLITEIVDAQVGSPQWTMLRVACPRTTVRIALVCNARE